MAYSIDTDLSLTVKRLATIVAAENDIVSADTQEEVQAAFLKVENAVTDLSVDLGGITTVHTLLILSDQPLTVKLNTQVDGMTSQVMFLRGASVTAVKLSNASGQNANARILLAGV